MQQKWFIKSYLVIILTLALQTVQAEYFNPVMDRAHHYVGLSLSGAKANDIKQNEVNMLPGVATALDFRYEVDYHHFLFGIGVGAQYQILNDGLGKFNDEFSRADKEGEEYLYAYNYSQYTQRSTMVNIELPITIGYNFATYGYILVGAKLTLPITASYRTTTDMYTNGFYPWATETYQSSNAMNFTSYGLFQKNPYTQQETYTESFRASVNVEIGGILPYEHMGKHRLRLGAYLDYGFRTGSYNPTTLVDYSEVNKVPTITDQQQLATLLHFNPIQFSDKYSHLPSTLEVGIKLTWLVDVTVNNEKCLLCEQVKKRHHTQRKYFR